jgi:hypothetical protein
MSDRDLYVRIGGRSADRRVSRAKRIGMYSCAAKVDFIALSRLDAIFEVDHIAGRVEFIRTLRADGRQAGT